MRIELDKEIVLTTDPKNFILNTWVTTKRDGKTLSAFAYYSTFEGALNGYLKHRTRRSDATSFKELASEVRELKEHIGDLLKPLSIFVRKDA